MPALFPELPWWGYALCALAMTHVTIVSVTVYLHRHMAHRSLELHPAVSHFFRFWLWLTTGMVTREWIAVHRKHHATVESADDPHSPQVHGIAKVLWLGAFLYHRASHDRQTLRQYGHGAPNDWVERRIYTPGTYLGPALMLVVNVGLFGMTAGVFVWLTQMLWIPFWAAGVINGLGHFFGYRNYELEDASRNIVPWGLVIGGEELHNNHHAFAGSAKFSSRRWELDLGWGYISLLARLGLAKVRRRAPQLAQGPARPHCDLDTVRAVAQAHIQVAAHFAREVMGRIYRDEARAMRRKSARAYRVLRRGHRFIVRGARTHDEQSRRRLRDALALAPSLARAYAMKQRLHEIWARKHPSAESLRRALEEWCRAAEQSGCHKLRDFSARLRSYRLQTAAAV